MSDWYIYGLFDPITHEIKYIGLTTKSLKYRYKRHFDNKEISYKYNWLKKLKNHNLVPYIKPIQIFDSNNTTLEQLKQAEIYWIKYFRENGCNLTNITDGGEGLFGYKPSIDLRKKWSLMRKGRVSPMKGKHHSEESKKKLSISLKGHKTRPWTIEERKHSSLVHSGYKTKEDTKIKLSIAAGGRPIIDEAGNIFMTMVEFAKKFGITKGTVWKHLKGMSKTCAGTKLRYLKDEELEQHNLLNMYNPQNSGKEF